GINVLASQASQLRKLLCELPLLDDAFTPHHRWGDRTALGYCGLHSAKGQQITRELRALFRLVNGHRGAHRYHARRGSTLLFRERKPYEICRLHHAQQLSSTPGLPVCGSLYSLHFTRGHTAACIPSAVQGDGCHSGAQP
ncbi:hypothetical protein AVDCRST_MAG81-4897, partial [uncultured Synechococcales cyanobacterium]